MDTRLGRAGARAAVAGQLTIFESLTSEAPLHSLCTARYEQLPRTFPPTPASLPFLPLNFSMESHSQTSAFGARIAGAKTSIDKTSTVM